MSAPGCGAGTSEERAKQNEDEPADNPDNERRPASDLVTERSKAADEERQSHRAIVDDARRGGSPARVRRASAGDRLPNTTRSVRLAGRVHNLYGWGHLPLVVCHCRGLGP